MFNDLVIDRGTSEIPPEILERPDIYPNPEDYTYKINMIDGRRNISMFKKRTEAEIIKRQELVKQGLAEILMRHPDLVEMFKA